MDAAILEREILQLSVPERAMLAERILRSFDTPEDELVLDSWVEEAKSRSEAIRAGKMETFDGKSIHDELRKG